MAHCLRLYFPPSDTLLDANDLHLFSKESPPLDAFALPYRGGFDDGLQFSGSVGISIFITLGRFGCDPQKLGVNKFCDPILTTREKQKFLLSSTHQPIRIAFNFFPRKFLPVF